MKWESAEQLAEAQRQAQEAGCWMPYPRVDANGHSSWFLTNGPAIGCGDPEIFGTEEEAQQIADTMNAATPKWLQAFPWGFALKQGMMTRSKNKPAASGLLIFESITDNGYIGMFNLGSLQWAYCSPEELMHCAPDLEHRDTFGIVLGHIWPVENRGESFEQSIASVYERRELMAIVCRHLAGKTTDTDRLIVAALCGFAGSDR